MRTVSLRFDAKARVSKANDTQAGREGGGRIVSRKAINANEDIIVVVVTIHPTTALFPFTCKKIDFQFRERIDCLFVRFRFFSLFERDSFFFPLKS